MKDFGSIQLVVKLIKEKAEAFLDLSQDFVRSLVGAQSNLDVCTKLASDTAVSLANRAEHESIESSQQPINLFKTTGNGTELTSRELVELFFETVQELAAEATPETSLAEAGDISSVVNLTEEVSKQANLLAINTAIEAAASGEIGRDLATVAEEVRVLVKQAEDLIKKG